jgi:AmmeMemoRadiSam system protein B/AmmeMemoRadiSam system protein A
VVSYLLQEESIYMTFNNFRHLLPLYFLLIFLLFFSACTKSDRHTLNSKSEKSIIHKSHLSGDWYPQNAETLKSTLDSYLAQAKEDFPVTSDSAQIKAIIVPHAGYHYSGLCAATAYQTLLEQNNETNSQINRVIILCPSHQVFLNNIAMPDYNIYQTVLGTIPVDTQALKTLGRASTAFRTYAEAHNREHAIEIQLPFLQKTIQNFKIVPLIIGSLTPANFHEAVLALKKIVTQNTLVVVSSDFTHFGSNYDFKPFSKMIFQQIRYIDSLAIQSILNLSGYDFEQILQDTQATICGQMAIKILLGLIDRGTYNNLDARLTCYYTSTQLTKAFNKNVINSNLLLNVTGDKDNENSVSYAGIVFSTQNLMDLKHEDQLTGFEKKSLLKQARQTIENYYMEESNKILPHLLYPIISPALAQKSGAFVTLNTISGNLRGCIGRIFPIQPLYQTISEMAIAAATQDSRFKPVTKEELDNLVIDITILSAPEKISSYNKIRIGTDGILLKKIGANGQTSKSSVFLPQVPASFGWNLQTTLEELSLKAGLYKDEWKSCCEFEIFQGFEIREN